VVAARVAAKRKMVVGVINFIILRCQKQIIMNVFKKVLFALFIIFWTANVTQAQILRDYINDAEGAMKGGSGKNKKGGLSSADIADGLRQALQIGAKNATSRVSAVNGFFGNALIKILMPPEARKVENTLREIGMGTYVDNAILSMNRAAEDGSSKALDIFVNAIKSMSIQDGLSILNGPKDAATQYLRSRTSAALTAAFRPIIEESLDKVNATKYWADVFNVYNDLPTTFKKVNPDLPAYVTQKALDGVFVYIADEEAKIRMNPAAQVTDLLKKVFGHH
jgi:hypothetical protein